MSDTARPYAPTALPSVLARSLAFVAILVGGLCGGLIGWAVSDLQCGAGASPDIVVIQSHPSTSIAPQPTGAGCTTWNAGSGVLGAGIGAGGTGAVAILVLRAMAEWRRDLDVEEPPDA
jgi:hypothetical protein